MDFTLDTITEDSIKELQSRSPEYKAMYMFMMNYSEYNGEIEDIMDKEEVLQLQKEDEGFRSMCDLLLDAPLYKTTDVETKGPQDTKLSKKQRLSIEIDRARMWLGVNHDRSQGNAMRT